MAAAGVRRLDLVRGHVALGLHGDALSLARVADFVDLHRVVLDVDVLDLLVLARIGWRGLLHRGSSRGLRHGGAIREQGDEGEEAETHQAIVGSCQRLSAQGRHNPGMSESKVVLLVDGSSYLYRAFHAMPDLRAVPGDQTSPATGAIRGMINMLQKLRKDVRADYVACVFDAPGKTFRDDLYPDYKATRSPMPSDLRLQIDPIHQVVRLLGWKVLSVPGVEADDVIGTLACMATERGYDTIISSGDKDLSQLVNENVTVIDTMNDRKRDVAGVEAECGV